MHTFSDPHYLKAQRKTLMMINKSIDPTTKFRFCLDDKLTSSENCTNGLFSSFSLQSQQELWSRLFNSTTENDDKEDKQEVLSSRDMSILSIMIIILLLLCVVPCVQTVYCCRRKKKSLTKKFKITIPKTDDDDAGTEMRMLKIRNEPKEDNEITFLLQNETENKSCQSDDTSTGYGSECSLTGSNIYCSFSNGQISSYNSEVNESREILSVKRLEDDFYQYNKTSDTDNAHSVKEKKVNDNGTIKTNLTLLHSPDKNYNQENNSCGKVDSSIITVSEEENVNDTPNLVCPFEGTDHEIKRLNWSAIFMFLISKIDPTLYVIFFTNLLENAGATEPSNIIKTVKMETHSMSETMFTLFNRWKRGAVAAKPKDIEDVFESLFWNKQLIEFREFMRNPPYLPENTKWNELNIPHPQTRDIAVSSENMEETVFESHRNESNIYTKYRNIKRRCYNDSPDDICAKYMRIDECSKKEPTKRELKRHFRSRERNNSKQYKYITFVNNKKRISSSTKRSTKPSKSSKKVQARTYSSSSAELISCPSSSGKLEYGFSSGYSSMSSNNDNSILMLPNNSSCEKLSENCREFENLNKLNQSFNILENRQHQQYQKPHTNISREHEIKNLRKSQKFSKTCKSTNVHWEVSSNCKIKSKRDRITPIKDNKSYLRGIKKSLKGKKKRNPKISEQKIAAACIEGIIDDLLKRMSPSREDVLSLTYKAYTDAECLKTSWNEQIFVISSRKHSLPIRESEWNTVREYVKKIRTICIAKSSHKNGFLFLNYCGKPFT